MFLKMWTRFIPTPKYAKLYLFIAYEALSETKLAELLYATDLGGKRPTELLARMRKLMDSEQSPAL